MSHLYKTLNKIQTHLLTWGNPFDKFEDTCQERINPKDIIVCVSGNPGIIDFYTEFGTELHNRTQLPVCIVGQAGHEEVPDKKSNELKGQEHLFDLQGQIDHKLDLIKNHISTNRKLHLIGHSIGAWIILEILNNNKFLIDKVASVNLLFPTVQHIAKSRNGIFLNYFVRYIYRLLMLLVKLVYLLPNSIKNYLAAIYMSLSSMPSCYSQCVINFVNPKVIEKVLFLAFHEMDTVQSMNYEIIDLIKDKTNVLYSDNDGWVPLRFIDDFKQFQPNLSLKQVYADHSFVLNDSIIIANNVSDFIIAKQ